MRFILTSALYLFVLGLSLSVVGAVHNTASADEALDGKTFTVTVTPTGKGEEPSTDELIFEGGTFSSTNCEQYGFGPAAYETRTKGKAVLFKSTLTSEEEGTAEWEGAVKGDKIRGTFIWTKDGQDPVIYTYISTPVKKAAPPMEEEPEIQRDKDKQPEAP